MKHTNKKGFTIVELVIVIAVIAILAAVLIPNLSRLVTKADKSAAMQEAKAAMDNDLINAEGDLANMNDYTLDGKPAYITATYTGYAAIPSNEGNTGKIDVYTLGENGTFSKSNDTDSTEGSATKVYYVVEKYEGAYDEGTKTYTVEKGGFTCTFANGEWKIVEK